MTTNEQARKLIINVGVERAIIMVEEIITSVDEDKVGYWGKILEYIKRKRPKTTKPLKRWCKHCSKWLTIDNFDESKQAKVLGYKTKCKECEK